MSSSAKKDTKRSRALRKLESSGLPASFDSQPNNEEFLLEPLDFQVSFDLSEKTALDRIRRITSDPEGDEMEAEDARQFYAFLRTGLSPFGTLRAALSSGMVEKHFCTLKEQQLNGVRAL